MYENRGSKNGIWRPSDMYHTSDRQLWSFFTGSRQDLISLVKTCKKIYLTMTGKTLLCPLICYCFWATVKECNLNKKVILHERKKLTACHVASTCCAALVGVPPPLVLTWTGGTPSSWSWMGVPPVLTLDGVPLSWPGIGVPPHHQEWGGNPLLGRKGYPHPCCDGRGYPHQLDWVPFPPKCGHTNTCESSTFPIPSDAGGNYCWCRSWYKHQPDP